MTEARLYTNEPYPYAPEHYFGVQVPDAIKADWPREVGTWFRQGVLRTVALIATKHELTELQDEWDARSREDMNKRHAWLKGEL